MNNKILLLILSFFVSTQCYGANYQHSQKKSVKEALTVMLTKTVDPFLIVEISGTKKYIQFYNDNPGLILDLPAITLSDSEIKLATVYFRKHGLKSMQIKATDVNSGNAFTLKGWRHTYNPGDLNKVVDIAIGALFEIYGISKTTPLTFTKGWE